MTICALQTARSGSKSIHNKNILLRNGKPLYRFNFESACRCKLIEHVFISTDIQTIIDTESCENIIKRPKHLCEDNSTHLDTILHGLFEIENRIEKYVDVLVILLGNNKGTDYQDLTKAIQLLYSDPTADSCMSVGEYNMFNPFRAFKQDDIEPPGNYITTVLPQEQIRQTSAKSPNEKNAFGSILFFNGSFWICRRDAIIHNNGLLPFPWIGQNVIPYKQPSDIMELDAHWQLSLI